MKSINLLKGLNLVCVIILLITACKSKKEEIKDTEPTKAALLVKNWSLNSVKVNSQEINYEEFSIVFRNDGTFTFNTPGIVELPQSGNYVMDTMGNEITLNNSVKLNVLSLTSTRFVFEYTYANHKEGNVKVLFTMQ